MRCSNPAAVFSNGNIIVSDYGDPPIEGISITFSCLHGLILIGSNSSTCMENGNWVPDLNGIQCIGELISIILKIIKYIIYSSSVTLQLIAASLFSTVMSASTTAPHWKILC